MKKAALLLAVALLAAPARAGYLKTPFTGGPIVKPVGVWVDPRDPRESAPGTGLALITHDPKDGCLLPSIVCEQWAPLATAITYNGGRFFWNIGPVANVFPWMVGGLRFLADKSGLSAADPSLHEALTLSDAPNRVTFSFGPQLNLNPVSFGKFQPVNHWNARLVLFTGAEVRW